MTALAQLAAGLFLMLAPPLTVRALTSRGRHARRCP